MNIFSNTLRKKIYFLSILSSIFFIGIAYIAYNNLINLSKSFDDFAQINSQAQSYIELTKDVEKLKGNVQSFTYSGYKGSAQEAKKLYEKITNFFVNTQLRKETEVDKSLLAIELHLKKYFDTFKEVERQKKVQKDLKKLKRDLHEKLIDKLYKYSQTTYKKSLILKNINDEIFKAEKYSLYYFDTMDTDYIKQYKEVISKTKKNLSKLKNKEVDVEKVYQLKELSNILKQYSKIFLKTVQQVRSYTFLINVVMSAELYEVLYYANIIHNTSLSIIEKIENNVDTNISDSTKIFLLLGVLFFIFMLTASLIITNSIVNPITLLTESFKKLTKGETDFKILEYSVNDEIGDLSTAAVVFQEKNKELQKYQTELEKLVISRTEELTKAQNHLIESEKMASLGSLVAGISHEINTPVGLSLTGVSYINEITNNIIKDVENNNLKQSSFKKYLEDVRVMSETMEKSLNDATELIKSFKQISVDQHAEQIRDFKLHNYVEDVLLSLKNNIKHTHIDITNNIPIELTLHSYPGIFSQIFTNLIMNSIVHAFDEDQKGNIYIEAITNDNNLMLTYIDNGKGMDDNTIKHIFDPFFTTKMGQGGSGLGMYIIYNLITQKLNGNIVCQSKITQETKFIITIPMESKDV